jgi:hypoxanthine phosphoribosyltransferase
MPEIIPYLKREEIDSLTSDIANRISSDYKGRNLIIIGVLTGAFIFMADLIRKISIPVKIDFIGASSYGDATQSTGKIQITKELSTDVEDINVLLVEDIVDTGLTLDFLIDYVKSFRPRSVKVCTLLDKQERRRTDVTVDYACRVVEDRFIVGYGLDHAGEYRQFPDIFYLKSEQ